MTKEDLLKEIAGTMQKARIEEISGIIGAGGFSVNELIGITFHQHKQTAFRAAWILENVCEHTPLTFLDSAAEFFARFPDQHNLSARRHFSKIACLLTGRNAPEAVLLKLKTFDLEATAETLFSWLIDNNVPVAVKANAMEALANLLPRFPWIKEELEDTISYLKDKESVAFFGRAKKVKGIIKRVKTEDERPKLK